MSQIDLSSVSIDTNQTTARTTVRLILLYIFIIKYCSHFTTPELNYLMFTSLENLPVNCLTCTLFCVHREYLLES